MDDAAWSEKILPEFKKLCNFYINVEPEIVEAHIKWWKELYGDGGDFEL